MDAREGATGLDIDALAASLRADRGDLDAFLEGLAAKLADVLPGRVKVERRREGILGPKRIRSVSVDTSTERLQLAREASGAVSARRAKVSGGIVLKTEEISADAWTEALSEALAAEAERSETTRAALERMLTQ